MSDEQHQPQKRRSSGSENRFRQTRINFRVSLDEHDQIKARAEAAGLSVGSFLRGLALPAPCFKPLPPLIWPDAQPGGRP